jgi:hypothetical protein
MTRLWLRWLRMSTTSRATWGPMNLREWKELQAGVGDRGRQRDFGAAMNYIAGWHGRLLAMHCQRRQTRQAPGVWDHPPGFDDDKSSMRQAAFPPAHKPSLRRNSLRSALKASVVCCWNSR